MNKAALPIIYVLDPSVAVTGAFTAARQMARALADTARVVLVLPEGSAIPPEALKDFWRIQYLPISGLSKNLRAMIVYLPTLAVGAWRLKRAMQREGATSLVLNDFYLMHGVLLRLFGFRGHIVTWVRCDPMRFAGFFARPMLWLGACAANRVIAVSDYVWRLLPSDAGAAVLYDAYEGMARAIPTWGAADEKKLVYVGNYIRGKGQDVAIAAFAIAAARDATLHLHFYGGDMGLEKNRAYRHELEAMTTSYGLSLRVSFHDFIASTATVLATAYAALNFSASESFSMTVLEASGAGVPIIATACGGPQEIIADGITGHLVAVGDVTAAAARIVDLASNPEIAIRMGQAGAAHVHAHFSPATFRQQLQAVLHLV